MQAHHARKVVDNMRIIASATHPSRQAAADPWMAAKSSTIPSTACRTVNALCKMGMNGAAAATTYALPQPKLLAIAGRMRKPHHQRDHNFNILS